MNISLRGSFTGFLQVVMVAAGTSFVATPAFAQLSQQGPKLVGSGAVGSALQGTSVSVSADGTTAIVGGTTDNGSVGAVWIWTRSGGVWTQQGPKLVGSGAVGNAGQGQSVSVSADGNTFIVGGNDDNGGAGAAWVWTRSGGIWSQQGPKLVGSGASGNAFQGVSVSVAADGNTAVVGGYQDNGNAGAAWIWTRSGGVWTQQGPKLVGSGAVGKAYQGQAVAVSADGATAIVGGGQDNSAAGAAWIWTRSGGSWTQQGVKLVGADAVGSARHGQAVSLSADGNTAIVGGAGDNGGIGAAWIWTRVAGAWIQQGTKNVGSGAVGASAQGYKVSLSADGNTALVGATGDNNVTGAAWLWRRGGDLWTQQGPKVVGSGAIGVARQGFSVAISADATTAVVGGPDDGGSTGAVWVFNIAPLSVQFLQQGPKLVASDAQGQQGTGVSLSADGNTALVGVWVDNGGIGAAVVWTRNGGGWSQQGPKLVGSGAVGTSRQGRSVSLSADGNTALVGGDFDNTNAGAAWVWTRSGGVWTQQGPKLVGSGAVGLSLIHI